MSEDLIKRSDAIDALKNALCELGGDEWGDGELGVHADDIDAVIKGIPSADVIEPKRGEWIEVSFNEKIKYMVCSECGNKYAVDLIVPLEAWIDEKHKFCGRCGADMRGKDDE